jgi:hypothetical protein
MAVMTAALALAAATPIMFGVGLAAVVANIQVLSVSTHYPADMQPDDGSTFYYRQRVLAPLIRACVGSR